MFSIDGAGTAVSPVPKGGWKAAIFIIVVEMAERFSFYGVTSGLISYLTVVMGEATATAAKNINLWQGVAFICPLFGAFVADSLLGRFRTALFSSLIYLFGLVFLFLSALVIPLKHRRPFFYLSLYILAVGEGGHKPSVQTFAADQFEESTAEQKAAKSSFFNWWYMGIVLGAILGIASVFFVQKNVGWAAAFGIPTASMALALAIFVAGVRFYRREPLPKGCGPFTKVVQVAVAAVRKRRAREDDKLGILDGEWDPRVGSGARVTVGVRTKKFRFLDKAMVIDEEDARSETKDPWRLCTLKQVEEVKQVLRLLPIWITCFPYSIVYAQLFTFFTKQANSMEAPVGPTNLKLPTPYIPLFLSTTLMLGLIVLYDRAFVPFARSLTGHPTGITILQRIGTGQFLSMAVMIVSALVEGKRVNVARAHGLLDNPKATVPLSVWWLLPQYMVLTMAEVFAVVGMQELFYDQMPSGLRSLGAAAYLILVGIGSFVSSGVISIVQAVTSRNHGREWLVDDLNRAHLDGFYWVLSVLCGLGFCGFVWAATLYEYKEIEKLEEDVVIEA
ncbi:hypothetical protein V2J09_011146 [Rumex salicifolius]